MNRLQNGMCFVESGQSGERDFFIAALRSREQVETGNVQNRNHSFELATSESCMLKLCQRKSLYIFKTSVDASYYLLSSFRAVEKQYLLLHGAWMPWKSIDAFTYLHDSSEWFIDIPA